MPKKKKTRKQKILTEKKKQMTSVNISATKQTTKDNREEVQTLPLPLNHSLPPQSPTKPAHQTTIAMETQTQGYKDLTRDLLRTGIVTSIIIFAQILIYFIVERG